MLVYDGCPSRLVICACIFVSESMLKLNALSSWSCCITTKLTKVFWTRQQKQIHNVVQASNSERDSLGFLCIALRTIRIIHYSFTWRGHWTDQIFICGSAPIWYHHNCLEKKSSEGLMLAWETLLRSCSNFRGALNIIHGFDQCWLKFHHSYWCNQSCVLPFRRSFINLIIKVPTNVSAPNSARPSPGTQDAARCWQHNYLWYLRNFIDYRWFWLTLVDQMTSLKMAGAMLQNLATVPA